jgi:hypothetical protein
MSGPFKLKSGNSPLFKQMGSTMKQTEKKKGFWRKIKEKVHKSEFAQKHLIVPKETKLSKIGKFVKKYIYDPK